MPTLCGERKLLWGMFGLLVIFIAAGIFSMFFRDIHHGHTPVPRPTKVTIKILDSAVKMFKLDTGRYPSREMGLIELIDQPADVTGWNAGGYLEMTELPRDAWKNEFAYITIPQSDTPFVIISFGADGKPGGKDYDTDLYSTDL